MDMWLLRIFLLVLFSFMEVCETAPTRVRRSDDTIPPEMFFMYMPLDMSSGLWAERKTEYKKPSTSTLSSDALRQYYLENYKKEYKMPYDILPYYYPFSSTDEPPKSKSVNKPVKEDDDEESSSYPEKLYTLPTEVSKGTVILASADILTKTKTPAFIVVENLRSLDDKEWAKVLKNLELDPSSLVDAKEKKIVTSDAKKDKEKNKYAKNLELSDEYQSLMKYLQTVTKSDAFRSSGNKKEETSVRGEGNYDNQAKYKGGVESEKFGKMENGRSVTAKENMVSASAMKHDKAAISEEMSKIYSNLLNITDILTKVIQLAKNHELQNSASHNKAEAEADVLLRSKTVIQKPSVVYVETEVLESDKDKHVITNILKSEATPKTVPGVEYVEDSVTEGTKNNKESSTHHSHQHNSGFKSGVVYVDDTEISHTDSVVPKSKSSVEYVDNNVPDDFSLDNDKVVSSHSPRSNTHKTRSSVEYAENNEHGGIKNDDTDFLSKASGPTKTESSVEYVENNEHEGIKNDNTDVLSKASGPTKAESSVEYAENNEHGGIKNDDTDFLSIASGPTKTKSNVVYNDREIEEEEEDSEMSGFKGKLADGKKLRMSSVVYSDEDLNSHDSSFNLFQQPSDKFYEHLAVPKLEKTYLTIFAEESTKFIPSESAVSGKIIVNSTSESEGTYRERITH